MAQSEAWEREYRKPQLMTKNAEPQADVKKFLKFLAKQKHLRIENLHILDLGSGTGRNSNYLASLGNIVLGMEISRTALELSKSRARELEAESSADYRLASIGEAYPCADESFDFILDVTSSNSLAEKERETYLSESYRVLKNGGYFFVKALCKDGDHNAKNLLKLSPGKEYDTYVMNELGLTERVFSREDFISLYSRYFEIIYLEKKTNYPLLNGRSYKRNYWIAYLRKIE